jgi:ankyrin repeat protein
MVTYAVVEKLLKRGDDVNKTDCSQDHSVTPLHTALIHGHDAIVELLLKHGADVHRAANNGRTPLHIAASNGRANVVEWLLDHHANLEAKDARGWTPLFVACFRGHLAVVRLLLLDKRYVLTMHPQVNWTDAHGQTPLMTACQRGHLHIVNILLQLGAQTWLQDEDGSTALNFAAEGYPEIVMVLLEHDMIVKANAMVQVESITRTATAAKCTTTTRINGG